MRVMRNCLTIIAILIGVIASGCSSPELERSQERSKVTLKGEFLTQNPDVINFPVRIIIAIDDSGSMAQSDPVPTVEPPVVPPPPGLRHQAAWEFIDSYRDFESVQFDVIHWNSTIQTTTGGFSRNFDDLREDVFDYDNTDETNYTGTLETIENHFVQEVSEMRNDSAQSANIARMKCVVLFFSDGAPDPWSELSYSTLYNRISQMETTLVEEEGVASFQFNTLFLSAYVRDHPVLYNQCQVLMEGMANRGNGIYEEFESADEINFINIADLRLTVEYKVKFVVACNINVRPGNEIVHVDSDGDGLTDEEELDVDLNNDGVIDDDEMDDATDPTLRDTDGDGLSDYLERRLSVIDALFDPNDPNDSNCPIGAEEIDRDRDGMTDCEEVVKGTLHTNPDTDSDGLPDGIEFLMGSDPFSSVATDDSDLDDEHDNVEVKHHTNVLVNDGTVRARYSYAYDIRDLGLVELYGDTIYESRRRRKSFVISNIDIMDTLAANGRLRGDNLIRLFIAEVPEDMPNVKPVYRVADILVNFRDTESRVIEVDSFEAL